MTRAEYLEQYLAQLDITNVDLARAVGVAPSSVQRWVAGTIEPPIMLLRLLECWLVLKRIKDISGRPHEVDWRPTETEIADA